MLLIADWEFSVGKRSLETEALVCVYQDNAIQRPQ
jgi:hypothetical protein